MVARLCSFAVLAASSTGCLVREIHHYPVQQHCGETAVAAADDTARGPDPLIADVAPPASPIVDVRGPAPENGCWFWMEGYWHWAGDAWQWIEGRYQPCVDDLVWVAPVYVDLGGSWSYRPGYYTPPRDRALPDPRLRPRDHRDGRYAGGGARDHRRSARDHRGDKGSLRPDQDVQVGEAPDRPWEDLTAAAPLNRTPALAPVSPRPTVPEPVGPPNIGGDDGSGGGWISTERTPTAGWTSTAGAAPSPPLPSAPPSSRIPTAPRVEGPGAGGPVRVPPPSSGRDEPTRGPSAPPSYVRPESPRAAPSPSSYARPEPSRAPSSYARPEPSRASSSASRAEPSRSAPPPRAESSRSAPPPRAESSRSASSPHPAAPPRRSERR